MGIIYFIGLTRCMFLCVLFAFIASSNNLMNDIAAATAAAIIYIHLYSPKMIAYIIGKQNKNLNLTKLFRNSPNFIHNDNI